MIATNTRKVNSPFSLQAPPPAALDAERGLVGHVLANPSKLDEISAKLNLNDFYDGHCRKVWGAILDALAAGEPVDLVAVGSRLQQEPEARAQLVPIFEAGQNLVATSHAVKAIKEASTRRQAMQAAAEIWTAAMEGRPVGELQEAAEAIISIDSTRDDEPRDIDLQAADENVPEAMDEVWDGFAAGSVGGLIAPGATGKSFWTLEAALSISCGVAGGDVLKLGAKKSGQVLYLSSEDPDQILKLRLHNIFRCISPEAKQSIFQNMTLKQMMGYKMDLMDRADLQKLLRWSDRKRLVVIDTISRFHAMDENKNTDMSQVLKQLEMIAIKTGAAVLFLHHVDKTSARDGVITAQSARGASALVDNARWSGFVARMSEKECEMYRDDGALIGKNQRSAYIKMGNCKPNYGPSGAEKWYRFRSGGVLHPVDLQYISKDEAKEIEKRSKVYAEDDF
ncbi:MAG: AAA family ATPase [Desulfomicrobium sp.]